MKLQNCKINKKTLAYYLCYQFVPRPYSIFGGKSNEDNFQEFKLNKRSADNETDLIENTYIKLKESISCRLENFQGKIGILLSGGVDSAAILHIASEIRNDRLYTMSAAYEGRLDHLKYCRELSEKYNTIHKEIIIKSEDIKRLEDIYDSKTISSATEPIGDNGILSMYIMLETLKDTVDIVLSGDGADVVFGGLDSHYLNYIDNEFISEIKNKLLGNKGMDEIFLQQKKYPEFEHYKYGEIFLTRKETKEVLGEEIEVQKPFLELLKNIHDKNLIKRQILIDLNFLVRNRRVLTKVPSGLTGLEVFQPYLDQNFINFALSIPSNLLIKNLETKFIFKKSLEGKLPDKILYQEKKGFSPPFNIWYVEQKRWIEKKLNFCEEIGINKLYSNKLKSNIGKRLNYVENMKIWLLVNLACLMENTKK